MQHTHSSYLKTILPSRQVDDLGCGLYHRLNKIPCDYLGIDKEPGPHGITFDLTKTCTHLRNDLAIVSWPINRIAIPWEDILPNYKDIIYLGKNFDGSACGSKQLWNFLKTRQIITVLPSHTETLIHYQNSLRPKNQPNPREEAAAIHAWEGGGILSYTPESFI